MENNFDKCTVYYDDTNKSSTFFSEQLSRHPNIEIKKASDYKDETMIVASDRIIGFVFPSENGEIPYNIIYGSREMRALKSSIDILTARDYIISHAYSKYVFEKLQVENPPEKIWEDLGNNESAFMARQQATKGFSKRELRKYMQEDMKEYRKYKKRRRNQQ